MTLSDATKQHISELRLPFWADPESHIELYLVHDPQLGWLHGPWVKLYDRHAQAALGMECPQVLLVTIFLDENRWEKFESAGRTS
jgi:hypothetical protein